MMKILFIASGSKGNATFIDSGKTLIQIDMGITKKRLVEGAKELGRTLDDIEGVLITHEHSDHIKGLNLIANRVPIYASEGTVDDCVDSLIFPGEEVQIGDFFITPFKSSHDAINPMNFVIRCGNERLGYITDTGMILDEGLKLLKDCDYYLIESNHDVEMEQKSRRPRMLIKRVLGDFGHLSNVDSANYACELLGPHTKAFYLGHLSDDCNTPQKALETYTRVFEVNRVDPSRFEIRCTSQLKFVKGGSWE